MIPADLHPSAAQVQIYPPFWNECEALSRATKNLHVPEGVLNTVLGKHRPKAAGIGGELTEFHSEKKKRIQNFSLRRWKKKIDHRRYKDVDGKIVFKCYIGSASTVVTMCTTQCTVKRTALCVVCFLLSISPASEV